MKRAVAIFLSVFFILLLASCNKQAVPKYGGTDINGLTADEAVKKCYELFEKNDIEATGAFSLKNKSIFDERTKLISLDECYIVEDYKPTESDIWYKEAYSCCVVQTSSVILCKEDCALGKKDEKVTLNYSYYLVMKDASSGWMIADFGYPPAVPLV
ncbi:MAG: hypothetical protein E7535_06185 [Ruminococcaceae bacterium]|nr:hypothetical protein [Oscillospiraceae bacterium]